MRQPALLQCRPRRGGSLNALPVWSRCRLGILARPDNEWVTVWHARSIATDVHREEQDWPQRITRWRVVDTRQSDGRTGPLRVRSRRGWDMTEHVGFLAELPVRAILDGELSRSTSTASPTSRLCASASCGGTPRPRSCTWCSTCSASRASPWSYGRTVSDG
jgi:hypothetical protein